MPNIPQPATGRAGSGSQPPEIMLELPHCRMLLVAVHFKGNSDTSVSLFFPNQLEPLGRKTDTLNLTADIPLSCPTPVRREGLLCSSPEARAQTFHPHALPRTPCCPSCPSPGSGRIWEAGRISGRMERGTEGSAALISLGVGEARGEDQGVREVGS